MDYDDNAFQAQDLHLAGEGGSKFSSVLHPYALPKFDFVDGLRFETLVENKFFLGIPIQEGNHWIEDFSQGTSGIEFISSAAESCSVSRHINVWSETISSQSVEMLLKSFESSKPLDSENMSINRKCDDSYQREAHSSGSESLNYKTQKDPIASEAQVGNVDSYSKNVTTSVGNDSHGVHKEGLHARGVHKDNPLIADRPEFDTITMNSAALGVTAGSTNFASCDKNDGIPSLYGSDFTADRAIYFNKEEKTPVLNVGSHVDKKEEMEIEVLRDASTSTVKETSQVAYEVGLACEDGKDASCDCTVQKLHKSEQVAGADKVSEQGSKKVEMPLFLCDLAVKEGDGAETVASENRNEASVERNQKEASQEVAADTPNDRTASFDLVRSSECDANHILESEGNSTDSAKPNCDSLNTISCSNTSNSDGEKQEAAKGMMVENVRGNGSCNEERSFTFEILVGSPSISGGNQVEAKRAKEMSHGPHQGSDARDGGEKVSPARKPRCGSQMDPKIVEDISAQVYEEMINHRGAKGTPARRSRLEPSKAAGQENAKKGKLNGDVKGIGAIPPNVIYVPASNLADLYTLVTPSVLFQQPFTDVQQGQLGAQILVYGSLIQGAAPDGACMVSAFGQSDGMRHIWEPTWHACLKRLQGTRTSHQASKRGPLQHKVVSSPVARASTLLGFQQPLSPLHHKRASPSTNFVGRNLSLLSQASFTGPWIASPQNSSFDAGPHFSGSHITEAIKLSPVKESSLLVSSTTSVTVSSSSCSAFEGNSSKTLSPISPSSSSDHPQRGDPTLENEYTVSVKKDSASVSDIEAKLASATLAISAAASVAKAAAAAAKVASNAAVQAKLMADEAFLQSENGRSTKNENITLPGVTSSNILKGGDGSNCFRSIFIPAKEASRRRVEAASAASKHAENLDAIVKAAELTEEAVSQARRILGALVESVPQVPSMQDFISNNVNRDLLDSTTVDQVPCPSAEQAQVGPSNMEMHTMNHDGISPLPREISRVLKDDLMNVVNHISSPVRSSDEAENATGLSKQNNITEGCSVEVLKDVGNCEAAWFSANVLSLADGRAFVNYTDLLSDDGSVQLKEFVALENDGEKPPKIRIAHPIIAKPSEGTRRRRRDAMTDYSWAIGDRVDAWMQNCWREGIVTKKKNETTLAVHFPVKGETLVVKAWDLRPTLLWKGGKWIEQPRSSGGCSSQGDTPQEKRLKPGSPVIEREMNDKDLKDINLGEVEKREKSALLLSLADEKILDVGNSNKAIENNLDGDRRTKTGLQKGVNIGVPKPGLNTKFMEVNKHYVSQRSNVNKLEKDSVKFSRYLMPRGSREGKYSSRIDADDKRAAESENKALNLGKLSQKDTVLCSAKAALSDAKLMEFGFCCDTEMGVVGPTIFPSQALMGASSEEIQSSNAKSEGVKKGKYEEAAGGKSTNVELRADVVEHRRSNRRIQPSSRLLEGLQSSLIASKKPEQAQY